MSDKVPPPLELNMMRGGVGTGKGWLAAFLPLTQLNRRTRSDLVTPLALDVTFQVPGEVLQLDFDGVRTGTFSKAQPRLRIQVALPPEPTTGDPTAELLGWLGSALDLAEEVARKKKIADGLPALREFVGALSAGVVGPAPS